MLRERDRPDATRRYVLLAILVIVAGLGLYFCWPRPPQMGADEETFRTVDALFTAITAQNEKLLGDCEKRLHAYHGAGKLPESAKTYLDGIIATARAGGWTAAAERLYGFMDAQRREGERETAGKKEKNVKR